MKEMGLEKLYFEDLNKMAKDGLPVLMHNYAYKLTHVYLCIFDISLRDQVDKQILRGIEIKEKRTNLKLDSFLEFILLLKEQITHCQNKENDIKNNPKSSYLSLD